MNNNQCQYDRQAPPKAEEIKTIADRMIGGQTEALRDLRRILVDLDVTELASEVDLKLFAACYFSKLFTAEIWENLATDASFDYNEKEKKLKEFTEQLGYILRDFFSADFAEPLISYRMAKSIKNLYEYFNEISKNPLMVFKGGRDERA